MFHFVFYLNFQLSWFLVIASVYLRCLSCLLVILGLPYPLLTPLILIGYSRSPHSYNILGVFLVSNFIGISVRYRGCLMCMKRQIIKYWEERDLNRINGCNNCMQLSLELKHEGCRSRGTLIRNCVVLSEFALPLIFGAPLSLLDGGLENEFCSSLNQ